MTQSLGTTLLGFVSGDALYSRERLQSALPALQEIDPIELWRACGQHLHITDTTYLFLNAPELWTGLSLTGWVKIMSNRDRHVQQRNLFDTSMFADITMPHKYLGLNSVRLYFEVCSASDDERRCVAAYLKGQSFRLFQDERDAESFADAGFFAGQEFLKEFGARSLARCPKVLGAFNTGDEVRHYLTALGL